MARIGYMVRGGTHAHDDGRVYRKGEIVYSDKDLMRGFPNKFKKVSVSGGEKKVVEEEATPAPAAADKEFQDTLEGNPPAPAGEDVEVVEEVNEGEASLDEAPEPGEDFGAEVTDDFQKARRAGVRVFKQGRDFSVVNVGSNDKLNAKPLHTRKQVEDFIKEVNG